MFGCLFSRKPAGHLTVRHTATKSGAPHLVLEYDGHTYSLTPHKATRAELRQHVYKLRTLFKQGAVKEIREVNSDV